MQASASKFAKLLAAKHPQDLSKILSSLQTAPEATLESALRLFSGSVPLSVKSYPAAGVVCDLAGTGPTTPGSKRHLGLVAADFMSIRALLVAAEVLARDRPNLPAGHAVRLIFLTGRARSDLAGVLDGLSEIYWLSATRAVPEGKFCVPVHAPITPVVLPFTISVEGKGTHGAYPELGIDPISALCQAHSAIQSALALGTCRRDFAMCNVTRMHAGSAVNVIPSKAEMGGELLTLQSGDEVQKTIKRKMEKIVEMVPKGMDCAGTISFGVEVQKVENAKAQAEVLREAIVDVAGKEAVVDIEGDATLQIGVKFGLMQKGVQGAVALVGQSLKDDTVAALALTWIRLAERRLECTFA